jgi:hypothetical protein
MNTGKLFWKTKLLWALCIYGSKITDKSSCFQEIANLVVNLKAHHTIQPLVPISPHCRVVFKFSFNIIQLYICTARVFSRESPWKVAQWTGRPIRESWGMLWLVIRLLSVRAGVSSSVRSILPCTERLYCIPLHTCQHAGALPATTSTSPTPRRTTVRTKYYYCRCGSINPCPHTPSWCSV